MGLNWGDSGEILLEAVFFVECLPTFFLDKTYYWWYHGDGWAYWREPKKKYIEWMLG